MAEHVAIIGGGFSGTMLAAQLVRNWAPRVTLIERTAEAGLGLAYGAAAPMHLLNLRARSMSAWADAPDHFARWLERQGIADAATHFAPRQVYGRYLREQLAAAEGVEVVKGEAVDIQLCEDGVIVALGDGESLSADSVVLATGNSPPAPSPGIDPATLPPGVYRGDPWDVDVADGLEPDDTVLVIGTGLTMVDLVLLLDSRGFFGRILALSRRGLTPRPHEAAPPPVQGRTIAPRLAASALLREVRERADRIGWRQAVDELRPVTQQMWRDAGADQRRRFLRHLRPWWDVHRHRIAPSVHGRIEAMAARGQLRVAAGKIVGAASAGGGALIGWRPRSSGIEEQFTASRIVNCTGPEGGLASSSDPLMRRLGARGLIRPGPCGLGIDVDEEMRVLDAEGHADRRLMAVGPPTRGALWEIIAVPDIRVQVERVARMLTG